MKEKILILSLFLLSITSYAQDLGLDWAVAMGGTSFDEGRAIATDANGNIYTTGFFEETIDFDPSNGTANLTSNGNSDIFIQKLDSDGNFLWVKTLGGTDGDRGFGIAVDENGNTYVTGTFGSTVDFDPGNGTFTITAMSGKDVFVLKLDTNGEFVWAVSTIANGAGLGITTDNDGDVLLTGGFTQPLSFNGNTIFVQKIDKDDGNVVWEAIMGGASFDEGRSIISDTEGNVYVTGVYSRTVDFDPGIDVLELTSNGIQDVFIQKLNSDGALVWARSVGGSDVDEGNSITLDGSNNVYVTGFFKEVVDFDPGLGTEELIAIGVEDIFVLKLNEDATFSWARQMGGDFGRALGIATDDGGNVYTTGYFTGNIDFDPGPGFNIINAINQSLFLQKLDPSGNPLLVKQLTGGGNKGYGIKIQNNQVHLVGAFQGNVDFDPNLGTTFLNSNLMTNDIFVTKLVACTITRSSFSVTACGSYTAPSGRVLTVSDTYLDTINNSNGCDSILTIELTVNSVDATVTESGGMLTANMMNATYQWIDCNNNDQPISGATDQSYTPTATGDYAVIVTAAGCSDTSNCFFVLVTSTNNPDLTKSIRVFPNPSPGQFSIDFGQLTVATIKVYNTYGQLMIQPRVIQESSHQMNLDAQPGLYLLEVSTDGKTSTFKVLVQ